MLLRSRMAVFAATISLGLWSEASAGGEWPAASTDDYWDKDVTLVAIAPDGTWGVATEPFIGRAIANAIADCKKKIPSKNRLWLSDNIRSRRLELRQALRRQKYICR